MKKLKYIILILSVFLSSCEKFIDEQNKSAEDASSVFDSEEGTESIISAAYVTLRMWYGKENSWDLTEAGTDLYTWGQDNRSRGFCTYEAFLTGEEQWRMSGVWAELYKGINTCNVILQNIDKVSFKLEQTKNYRKGEISFLRAHYYWLVAEIWGGGYLTTEPTEKAIHVMKRSGEDDFYKVIFADLDTAIANLPLTVAASSYGRVTKPAAEAFKARLCLTRKDYAQALALSEKVISSYSYKLVPKWKDIWHISKIKNDEVIWAVNYSNDLTYTRSNLRYRNSNNDYVEFNTGASATNPKAGLIQRAGGSQGFLMWAMRYEDLGHGMERDTRQGRGFQRWHPTKYLVELYNNDLDQRFLGSFRDVFYCNSNTVPTWEAEYVDGNGDPVTIPDDKVGQNMLNRGDTALLLYQGRWPKDKKLLMNGQTYYIHPTKGYAIFDIDDMYNADGSINEEVNRRQFYFTIVRKWEDTTKLTSAPEDEFSRRDVFVIRMAEMYLIAAEAAMQSGDVNTAYTYLTTLANARAKNGNGAELLSAYGINSGADLTINFFLDERARELASEQLRMFDLKRTGTFYERVKTYNPDASIFVKPEYVIRFFPQSHLDALYDKTLFPQNPGY